MSNIRLYKLVTNEEIICEVLEEKESGYLLIKNAVSVIYQKTDKGLVSGFGSFMPHAEGDIILSTLSIMGIGDVHPEVLANYNSLFSNIVVPPSKIIV